MSSHDEDSFVYTLIIPLLAASPASSEVRQPLNESMAIKIFLIFVILLIIIS